MKYPYRRWFMLNTSIGVTLLLSLLVCIRTYAQVGEVIWEENFNALDTDIWNVDVGDGCDQGLCGWGNQELQWYSEDNVSIEPVPGEPGNTALVLEARNQGVGGKAFTSGKIQSNSKLAVQYGMIEVRMRVPNLETGLWPAAWLLGTSTIGWPGKGEIDMMEMGHAQAERARQGYPAADLNSYVGSNLIFAADAACSDGNPNCAASTAYDVEYNKPYVASTPLSNRFVTYRLYWTSETIRFTITDNGTEYDLYEAPFVIGEESTEFQQPFYLLLNLAVGGTFTDASANGQVTAPLPAKMYVDYIRISKYNGEGEVFYGNINPPETGTFGVFTDDTPTTNQLQAGVTSDIYAWGNLVEGNTAPYEGEEVIAWQFNAPNSWFGGGIVTRQARDMSNFEDGNLKFKIKIPANVSFRIGITDTYTNESYVEFPANQTKYGLVRNGEWGEATIPISELKGDLIALQSMQYLFAIASVDGAFPASNFQLAIDDVYWEGGGGAPEPVLTSINVSPASATIDVNDTQQFSAQALDQNGNPTNATINWAASGGTISGSGQYTATTTGTFTITASSGNVSSTATVTVNAVNSGVTLPARLEAEEYTGMSGVQLEATTDTGGGQNVGWIEGGDWLEYEVSVPTSGSYTVSYRVASETAGGTIVLSEDGADRATTTFEATRGWQVWETVSETVSLTAGTHVLRLTAATGGWNLNWLEFKAGSNDNEEGDITDQGGTVVAQYTDSPAGEGVANLIDNDVNTKYLTFHASGWIQYQAPNSYVVDRYSITSANDAPARDPLRWTLQGSNDGTAWTTIDTRSGEDFASRFLTRTFTFSNNTAYSYYRFNLNNNSGTVLQLAEIALFGEAATVAYTQQIEAEDYRVMSGVQTETCSEGGLNVGYLDTGDWIVWDIDVSASGSYLVEYRVASPNNSGAFQLENAGGSPVYGTPVTVPNTGGWQNWTTVSQTVNLPAGQQQIAVSVQAEGWNLNWLRISSSTPTARVAGPDAKNVSTTPLLESAVLIYPNPTTDELDISGLEEPSEVTLYNTTGKLVKRYPSVDRSSRLDVRSLKSGMYLLKVSGSEVRTYRFIKE